VRKAGFPPAPPIKEEKVENRRRKKVGEMPVIGQNTAHSKTHSVLFYRSAGI
jgi:hypothetical protein